MQITFLGAAMMVTGSSYLVETAGRKILIDCGMFQGGRAIRDLNSRPFAYRPSELDAVLLTHAHIDHSGLLPRLCKEGYRGPIYTGKVTTELAKIMLPDSAYIQEFDSEILNRKGKRAGRELVKPLYTVDDAYRCLKQFSPVVFDQKVDVVPGVQARFRTAGHILGSAIIELWVNENGQETKVVFSGDLGQPGQPIIKDPERIDAADYIVVESTYGDRLHDAAAKEEVLGRIINDTVARGGNVVIPAFAVGRTQTLLYYIRSLIKSGMIPAIPVIIDSPMAISATDVFLRYPEEYDEEARAILAEEEEHPILLPNLRFAKSLEESKAINFLEEPAIIISASGMADAGRILHHLKHNLWRREASVVLVGYQAQGSLGRRLLEGIKRVRILGEQIRVNAEIHNLDGFSAHADKAQLLDWLSGFRDKPAAVFVTHGEQEMSVPFAQQIKEQLALTAQVPQLGDAAVIDGREWTLEESSIPIIDPAVRQVNDRLREIERQYRDYKQKLEQKALSDSSAAAGALQRLERLERFIRSATDEL
ncbi:MAG: MBL fold metallo-hydrolase [Sporomusaceae bacterium]|nr:MBL fold metallo-hydrolase [Sporomusaceae bacterium]